MADRTKIEWVKNPDGTPGGTWNPVVGCSHVSDGCTHCYAEAMARRFGMTPLPWTAQNATQNVRCLPERLDIPLHWKKPRRIFVCSMSDLFHEQVPDEFIDEVLWRIFGAEQHTFQVLTKRPERMIALLAKPPRWCHESRWPLHNLWLGVTAENQREADRRIPLLLQVPAAVRFVSVEPLLGPVQLEHFRLDRDTTYNALEGCGINTRAQTQSIPNCWGNRLNWVIVGGESGPQARPLHPDWARSLRDQCQAAGVPFFFKAWGEWLPFDEHHIVQNTLAFDQPHKTDWHLRVLRLADGRELRGRFERYEWADGVSAFRVGKKTAGSLLDGREWKEYPCP